MAVSLPTAADVRKVREQAAERAEVARTPLLAALGAGDLAVTAVTKAAVDVRERAMQARGRATTRAGDVQHRVTGLPQRLRNEDLREDIRKALAEMQKQLETAYADFAERGEAAWDRLREKPRVKQAIDRLESYTEKLDSRVDTWVDDAHDAAEKALETVTRQTRSTGERVARATKRFTGEAAEAVAEASSTAGKKVAEAGAEVAEEISEAGAEVAHETRSVTRKAANRIEPKDESGTEHKPAARKPAARKPAGGTGNSTS